MWPKWNLTLVIFKMTIPKFMYDCTAHFLDPPQWLGEIGLSSRRKKMGESQVGGTFHLNCHVTFVTYRVQSTNLQLTLPILTWLGPISWCWTVYRRWMQSLGGCWYLTHGQHMWPNVKSKVMQKGRGGPQMCWLHTKSLVLESNEKLVGRDRVGIEGFEIVWKESCNGKGYWIMQQLGKHLYALKTPI